MQTLLFIIMSVLFSCGTKNANAQLQESKEKHTQNNSNYVSVFLDIDFSGKIQIFDKPNGTIIKTLKNNIHEGDFIMFDLSEKNDSMFYITAYSSLDNTLITKGWIYKNNHIGIYSSTYNRNFILYKIPYNEKEIIAIDTAYNPNMYEVIDFEGKWLKIKAKINNTDYEGWIPPEEQCSNVYSTCN